MTELQTQTLDVERFGASRRASLLVAGGVDWMNVADVWIAKKK